MKALSSSCVVKERLYQRSPGTVGGGDLSESSSAEAWPSLGSERQCAVYLVLIDSIPALPLFWGTARSPLQLAWEGIRHRVLRRLKAALRMIQG